MTKGKETEKVAIVVSVEKKKPKSALDNAESFPPRSTASPRTWSRRRSCSRRAASRSTKLLALHRRHRVHDLPGRDQHGPVPVRLSQPARRPGGGQLHLRRNARRDGQGPDERRPDGTDELPRRVRGLDWAVGDTKTQPGRVDGGACPANKFGALVRAVLSDHVDGAVVSIDTGKASACAIVESARSRGSTRPRSAWPSASGAGRRASPTAPSPRLTRPRSTTATGSARTR